MIIEIQFNDNFIKKFVEIFKRNFAAENFIIKGKKINDARYKPYYDIPVGFNNMLEALKMFGNLITKLRLDYHYFHEKQCELVNEHISKYAADSLVEIELKNCNGVQLKNLTGPFKNVETVRLRHGNVRTKCINFNEIFPAVCSLDLRQMFSLSPATIEHHFPLLKQLKVEFLFAVSSPHFERRLRLNPQLTSLYVFGADWQRLKMISEVLPDLQRIELTFDDKSDWKGDDIHFEHVRVFSVRMLREFPDSMERIPINFESLEEITCIEPTSKWFDVIIRNKNLTKITAGVLNGEQIRQIAENLPNVKEFHTKYDVKSMDDVDKIMRFIEVSKNLKTATFSHSNDDSNKDIYDFIHGKLTHEWTFRVENDNLIFDRKKYDEY